MKVQNINLWAYADTAVNVKNVNDKEEKKNKNVINGAKLNLGANTAEQKIEKERQALKIKLDQFMSDDEYNQEMKTHLEREAELKQDAVNNYKEVKSLEEKKQLAQEAYGVEDGSEEQKTLEEIEAIREKQKSGKELTKEELERLGNADDLTDYQKQMLEYDDAMDEYTRRSEDSSKLAKSHQSAVENMKQALLQVHPMVDASKQANEIIQDALKEEQNTLMAEMKENYDEKIEEEKQEQQEEETVIEQQANLEKKVLLNEELKGIEVDEIV